MFMVTLAFLVLIFIRNVVSDQLPCIIGSNSTLQTNIYNTQESSKSAPTFFEASDNVETVTKILEFLLSLLKNCKQYIDISCHGINKLVSYFSVMTHLLLSKQEKLLLSPYFTDLWQLFHPKLSEPSILYLLWTQDILTILVPMFHR